MSIRGHRLTERHKQLCRPSSGTKQFPLYTSDWCIQGDVARACIRIPEISFTLPCYYPQESKVVFIYSIVERTDKDGFLRQGGCWADNWRVQGYRESK